MEGGGREANIETNANKNVEWKMDMDDLVEDDHVEPFLTLNLEISKVASENQRETEETDGGRKEAMVESDAYDRDSRVGGYRRNNGGR